MLKVIDNRKTEERQLYKLEANQFFIWDDCVFRRMMIGTEFCLTDIGERIPCVLQTTREVYAIGRESWVIPLHDNQVELLIDD